MNTTADQNIPCKSGEPLRPFHNSENKEIHNRECVSPNSEKMPIQYPENTINSEGRENVQNFETNKKNNSPKKDFHQNLKNIESGSNIISNENKNPNPEYSETQGFEISPELSVNHETYCSGSDSLGDKTIVNSDEMVNATEEQPSAYKTGSHSVSQAGYEKPLVTLNNDEEISEMQAESNDGSSQTVLFDMSDGQSSKNGDSSMYVSETDLEEASVSSKNNLVSRQKQTSDREKMDSQEESVKNCVNDNNEKSKESKENVESVKQKSEIQTKQSMQESLDEIESNEGKAVYKEYTPKRSSRNQYKGSYYHSDSSETSEGSSSSIEIDSSGFIRNSERKARDINKDYTFSSNETDESFGYIQKKKNFKPKRVPNQQKSGNSIRSLSSRLKLKNESTLSTDDSCASSASDDESFKMSSSPYIRGFKNYTSTDDITILKYIYTHKLFGQVGGRVIWEDMAKKKIIPGRSWHSLKERFRRRIFPRITTYKKLPPKVIKRFQEKVPTKTKDGHLVSGKRSNLKYTETEDQFILKFITKNSRYREIKGKSMWVSMSNVPGLKDRTWESLKNRFLQNIAPNLDKYNVTDNEKRLFEKYLRGKVKKGVSSSSSHRYSSVIKSQTSRQHTYSTPRKVNENIPTSETDQENITTRTKRSKASEDSNINPNELEGKGYNKDLNNEDFHTGVQDDAQRQFDAKDASVQTHSGSEEDVLGEESVDETEEDVSIQKRDLGTEESCNNFKKLDIEKIKFHAEKPVPKTKKEERTKSSNTTAQEEENSKGKVKRKWFSLFANSRNVYAESPAEKPTKKSKSNIRCNEPKNEEESIINTKQADQSSSNESQEIPFVPFLIDNQSDPLSINKEEMIPSSGTDKSLSDQKLPIKDADSATTPKKRNSDIKITTPTRSPRKRSSKPDTPLNTPSRCLRSSPLKVSNGKRSPRSPVISPLKNVHKSEKVTPSKVSDSRYRSKQKGSPRKDSNSGYRSSTKQNESPSSVSNSSYSTRSTILTTKVRRKRVKKRLNS